MEFMEAQTYLGPSFDAKKLTIAQLSSLLSAHGVPLPPSLQRKAVYVDLFQAQVQAKASKILKSLKPVQPSSKGIEFVGASEEQPEEEPLNDENYNDENAPVVVVTARKAPSTPLVDSNSNTPLTARKKLRVSEEGQGRVLVPLTDANQNHTLPERVITPIKTLVPATEERPASPSKLPLLASMQSPRRASSRFTKLMAERPQMSPAPIDKEETPKDDEKEVAPTLDRFMISANMPGIRSKVSASVAETEDVKPAIRKTRRQSLIPRVKEEEPLKVSELKAFWDKKCKEAKEELENKELPALPVEEAVEEKFQMKEEEAEVHEAVKEEIQILETEESRFSSLPIAALFKGILALAFLSGLTYLFLSTSIPSLIAEETYARIEQVGKLVREQMVIPASWVLTGKYSWLEEQALDVWDSLTAIGDVWTDKETWRLIFSRMSLALTPIVNWILVFSQEVTNRSQVFVDTVAPWFLSWSVWDAGLLGLLTAALGVLVWDFL